MKKNLFLLLAAPAFLFSCAKQNQSKTPLISGKKYKVTFNIANFSQSQGIFTNKLKVNSTSADTLTNIRDYLNLLYYDAYNQFGRADNHVPIVQDSTMANMGTIVDSLPAGTYNLQIVAGKKGLALDNYYQAVISTFGYGGFNWQDTFWANVSVTVGNQSLTKTVTLNRVVSKIEIQILDNIPANADSLIMTMPDYGNMNFYYGSAQVFDPLSTTRLAVKIPTAAKGHPNFIIDKIIANTVLPYQVDITCKDASNAVIAHADANNVVSKQNTKTIVSGKLFGGSTPAAQGFQVKIDTAWASTPNVYIF